LGGIEAVRYKLSPSVGDPELFFLAGDEGVELFFKRMSQYHWAVDASGRPSDIPDDDLDDEVDALRYAIMNVFKTKGKVTVANDSQPKGPTIAAAMTGGGSLPQGVYTQTNWAAQVMQSIIQPSPSAIGSDENGEERQTKGKRGGFIWDLSCKWKRGR
jgi:hypothetical protein